MTDFSNACCKILVVGVGGGGCNAVNRMIDFGVENVEYVAVNTDVQVLQKSKADKVLQIGKSITQGQGAGALPEIGRKAAEESEAAFEELFDGVHMVFVTAGMGGGTGTGAAPVIARIAKKKGCLTVAVVTTPFNFEGRVRMENAQKGIAELVDSVDTLLIISNNKLKYVLPADVNFDDAFSFADETLRQAIHGTTSLILDTSMINLDFRDLTTAMKDKGLAHMGVGIGEGENRVLNAIRQAVDSPLLDTTINNAKCVVINVRGSKDLQLKEVESTAEIIRDAVAKDAIILFGGGSDPTMPNGRVLATVIATGFDIPVNNPAYQYLKNKGKQQPAARPFSGAAMPVKDITPEPSTYRDDYRNGGSEIPPTRLDADIPGLPEWMRGRLKK